MGGSQQFRPGKYSHVSGADASKLTTKEPDDEQLEVAICSFLAAMVPPRDRRKVLDLNVIQAMRKLRSS